MFSCWSSSHICPAGQNTVKIDSTHPGPIYPVALPRTQIRFVPDNIDGPRFDPGTVEQSAQNTTHPHSNLLTAHCSDRYNIPTLLSYLDRTVRPRAQLTSGPGSAVTLQAMVRLVCFSFGWCSRLSSTTETTGASRQHSQLQSAFVFLVCYMECVDMEEQNIIRNFQTNPSLDMAQFSQIREICQPASRITEGKF